MSNQDLLTADHVRALLREACSAAGGQAAWARKHGIHEGIVCSTLAGRRRPGKRLCRAIGVEAAELFRKRLD